MADPHNSPEARAGEAMSRGGLGAMAGVAVLFCCGGLTPVIAALFGGVALTTTLGMAGAIIGVGLLALGLVTWIRARRSCELRTGDRAAAQPASTGSSASSLTSVSASSDAGSESRTTPTPA